MCRVQYSDSSLVFRSKKASRSQLGYLHVGTGRRGDLERFLSLMLGGGPRATDCGIHADRGFGTSCGGGVTVEKGAAASKEWSITGTGSEVASSSESELLDPWSLSMRNVGMVMDDLACLPGGWPHLSHFMPPVDVPA